MPIIGDPINSTTVGLAISTPAGWLPLNDQTNYSVGASGTRSGTSTNYNRIEATSPVLAGAYPVHITPGMVTEQVQVYIYGTTMTQVQANYQALLNAFEQWTYELKWTFLDRVETWNCNAISSATIDMGQGMLHNYMATITLTVPRFPAVIIGS